MNLYSDSVKETRGIGYKIGKELRSGEVIFLSGILGAGKTELIRGIAKGLGVKSKIPSPTFNIFRVYDYIFSCRNRACPVRLKKKGKLYHFDCYRLKNYSDLVNLGWEEILADKNSVIVLEWPECIADKDITKLARKKVITVEIKIKDSKRTINLSQK